MADENEVPEPSPLSDEEVNRLWDEYYDPLKQSISRRVSKIQQCVANESEIALSAFNSFVNRARAGEFPDLDGENAHWKLLRTIAVRKANALHRKLWAERRGGGVRAVSLVDDNDRGGGPGVSMPVEGRLEAEELLATLLQRLSSETERNVILMRLEGCGSAKIAMTLDISIRTVQRILKNCFDNWNKLVA